MKRAALITGISLAALASAWPTAATAWIGDGWSTSFMRPLRWYERPYTGKKSVRKPRKDQDNQANNMPAVPPGPLQIIVSLDSQRVTLFANGEQVAHSTISSGTNSHPTQMGVFTVIQKNRYHVSNLYGAEMPYMQRLTWSGTAMHQGPLPGYPASHGCIRLTPEFARFLWKATKIGVRVIVTRGEATPVDIAHPRLFVPKPKSIEAAQEVAQENVSAAARGASAALKTADATGTLSAAAEPARPAENFGLPSIIVEERPSKPKRAPTAQPVIRKNATVSVFVSRKDGKLYVRHGMAPLFETPISIEHPDRPLGTHVYTAMEPKDGGSAMHWTVVSIPSEFKSAPEAKTSKSEKGKKPRRDKAIKVAEIKAEPPANANEALDRIAIPTQAVERIAELIVPGSSLIISDNELSSETGRNTDFVVLTR